MRVNSVSYSPYATSYPKTNFRGMKEEVISTGLKEVVSTGLPIYKAGRALHKLGEGDTKGALKQGIGLVDNIVMQPTKQSIATLASAKGAAIGSVFGPVGTFLGAGIGYFGTLLCWGKVRNTVVDGIMGD